MNAKIKIIFAKSIASIQSSLFNQADQSSAACLSISQNQQTAKKWWLFTEGKRDKEREREGEREREIWKGKREKGR